MVPSGSRPGHHDLIPPVNRSKQLWCHLQISTPSSVTSESPKGKCKCGQALLKAKTFGRKLILIQHWGPGLARVTPRRGIGALQHTVARQRGWLDAGDLV